MLTDDDMPRPKPRFAPLPLERLGVDELATYIADLRGEIVRVEAEIARKRDVHAAAHSVFKF